jgi:hypothetical protein
MTLRYTKSLSPWHTHHISIWLILQLWYPWVSSLVASLMLIIRIMHSPIYEPTLVGSPPSLHCNQIKLSYNNTCTLQILGYCLFGVLKFQITIRKCSLGKCKKSHGPPRFSKKSGRCKGHFTHETEGRFTLRWRNPQVMKKRAFLNCYWLKMQLLTGGCLH